MSIRIYNSLTKKSEEFKPLKGKTINMYSCGVTVYDECHIGHARSLYVFDVICRYLKHRGFKVNFVRNITDIDDKIINKAKELGKTSEKVSAVNIDSYYKDLESLQIAKADKEPRATQNIDSIKEDISGLIEKGFAYHVDGDVYFSVRKFKGYGKLSGQSIEKMQEAVRIEKDEKKKDPLDFALWKKSKEDEPSWPSPWGEGRPGWHIECSCMSLKYLNCKMLDIHAGGQDLIFPHHENEIAQSEALIGKPFAKYWIHHGLLTINGQKMAKSSGNFITIKDALKKYDADILKLFFLSSHYRSPIDFSEEKMEEAKKVYERIDILVKRLDGFYDERPAGTIGSGKGWEEIDRKRQEFLECMDDDFNTPRAMGVLFDVVHLYNKVMDSDTDKEWFAWYSAITLIKEIIDILGLKFPEVSSQEIPASKIEWEIAERARLKKEKKFQEADKIRSELEKKGIILEDTKIGTTVWRKKR